MLVSASSRRYRSFSSIAPLSRTSRSSERTPAPPRSSRGRQAGDRASSEQWPGCVDRQNSQAGSQARGPGLAWHANSHELSVLSPSMIDQSHEQSGLHLRVGLGQESPFMRCSVAIAQVRRSRSAFHALALNAPGGVKIGALSDKPINRIASSEKTYFLPTYRSRRISGERLSAGDAPGAGGLIESIP
jgi:hypothetical protein